MSFLTLDQRTVDNTGVFLVSELQRMDQTLHMPLVAYTWSRDVDIRNDFDIGFESTSYIMNSWAATGGAAPAGKAWVGKSTTQLPAVTLDAGQVVSLLTPWSMQVSYTVTQLQSSMALNRPIDEQQVYALREKWQMDIDEQVYTGDANLGQTGLINKSTVTATNVVAGASSSTLWSSKSADEILADVNTTLYNAWAASGWSKVPTDLLLPPAQLNYITTAKVSSAMPMSIIEYIKMNSLTMSTYNQPLRINACKWLIGAGASSANRMVAYTKDYQVVRFPMTQLQALPIQYVGVYMSVPYICKLGEVEVVRPEMFYYADGI